MNKRDHKTHFYCPQYGILWLESIYSNKVTRFNGIILMRNSINNISHYVCLISTKHEVGKSYKASNIV